MTQTPNNPKVSIVLPTYNHLIYLPQALQSILNQTFQDYEIIVVDDGSTDGTAAWLAGINHPKLRVITKQNEKLPAALNTGFAEARGEYWTWTSADNIVAPTWLEILVRALEESPPEVGYALSSYANINEAGQILNISDQQCFETQRMLTSNGNASFLYRADIAKATGLYDTELNGAEDMDMWLRMSQLTRGIHVKSVLYYYRLHQDSMTAQIPQKITEATTRMIDKFLAGSGGKIDVERIFPGIKTSANPALARWQAKIWLAPRFAACPFWRVEPIVEMLIASLTENYQSAIVGNIIILLARNGAWQAASEVISACRQKDQSAFIQSLADNVARQDKDALGKIPFVSLPDEALSFDRRPQLVWK